MATQCIFGTLFLSIMIKITISQATCGGNADNATCVFPFIYGEISFDQCTTYKEERAWCSTTSNYDIDKKWGYCDCTNVTPAPTYVSTEPSWYTYTRGNLNNGVLETVVIRVLYQGDSDISDFEWANYSAPSISLYYMDSSWGKLDYAFTIIDENYQSNLNGDTASTGATALEGFRLAEKNGYVWCHGICGTNGRARRDVNHFDQMAVVVRDHDANPAHDGWAGRGTIGTPRTWLKSSYFRPGVTEHEFGHNLGLNHQYNAKSQRIWNNLIDIGASTDGESRMGSGGSVESTSEKSRYQNNGHFGPCAKEHFGWLEPENVVTLSRNNISNGIFTLNAYDRPDVIPNNVDTISATGSNIFLLKVEYGSQYEYYANNHLNIIYIYYRTAYAGEESGASVQFCVKDMNGWSAGATINTFTYDVKGYTHTQKDHYVDIGQSFIIQPTIHSFEDLTNDKHVNPLEAKMNLINLTVLSVGNGWQYCSKDTYICNVTYPNLSLTVSVDFINDYEDIVMTNNSQKDPFNLTDTELYCAANQVQQIQIDTKTKNYHVIHVQADDELGIYGRGLATINFCATKANLQAYVFDEYPYNILNNDMNNDIGIGSLFSYPFNGNFESYSCTYPNCKMEAVQVIQNNDDHLHIAELEIFEEINQTNIANQASCFSFPSYSYQWYGGSVDHINDDDINTYSHSNYGGQHIFDACTFDNGVGIQQLKVWPRQSNWARSSNMTVKLWRKKLYGSTQSENEMSFSGLLFTYDINETNGEWDGNHESIIIPNVLYDLEPEQCNVSIFMDIPFISGEFWLVVQVADDGTNDGIVDIEMNMNTCNISQCPINTYINGMNNDGSLMCKRCPYNYYADVGSISINDCKTCPLHRELLYNDQSWCDIEECQTVVISHNNGLGNLLDGIYHLFGKNEEYAIYVSETLNYVISYNLIDNQYEIINILNDEIIAESVVINENNEYPFLIDKLQWNEEGVIHFNDVPLLKTQIIIITQRRNDSEHSASYSDLSIAEIEIFPRFDPTLNIAPTHANCFNFPINPSYGSYDGDEYGRVNDLNDNNTYTSTRNGGDTYSWCVDNNCINMCYLNEAMEIDHIVLYPPQNNWRYWRTRDLKLDIYDSVEFTVNNITDTNINNTLMDNAILGELIYSLDHFSMTWGDSPWSKEFNTTGKIFKDFHQPIEIQCTYKYALHCDNRLNEECFSHFGDGWIARFAEFDEHENDDIRWLCFNHSHLTKDTLNYKMISPQPISSSLIYQSGWKWNMADDVDDILIQCENDFMVKDIDYTCTVNNIPFDIHSINSVLFNGGDKIICNLNTKNTNSEIIIFDNLLWSISIIATENSNCYFPIKSNTTIDTENEIITTSFTIPNCRAIWDISFVFNQVPVGGNEFILWTKQNVEINIDDFDEIIDNTCVEFDGNKLLNFIDDNTFNNKFSYFTDVTMEILSNGPNNWCYQTSMEPSIQPTSQPTLQSTLLTNAPSIPPASTPSPTSTTSSPTPSPTDNPAAGPSGSDIYFCNYYYGGFNGAWTYDSVNQYTKNTIYTGNANPFVMHPEASYYDYFVIDDADGHGWYALCRQSTLSSCTASQWEYWSGSAWTVDNDAYISSTSCPPPAESNNKLEASHSFKSIEEQPIDNKSYPLNMTEMHVILGILILVLIIMCGMIFGFFYYLKKNKKNEKQIAIAQETEMVYFERANNEHNTPTIEHLNDSNQNQPSLKINVNGTATMVTKLPTTTPVTPLINLDQDYE